MRASRPTPFSAVSVLSALRLLIPHMGSLLAGFMCTCCLPRKCHWLCLFQFGQMTFGKKIIPTRGNPSSKHDPVKGFREKKGFKPLNGLGNHTGNKKYTRSLDTETIIFSSKQIHIVRMLCNSADCHMRALVTCAPTSHFPRQH